MTQHDARGNPIEEGCRVAYNISGDIALGEVLSVGPRGFKVRLGHFCAGKPAGHISKVRRATSILVLTPADMP